MPVDHLSLAVTPLVALKNEEPQWQGTGFFYVHESDSQTILYLVTSEHVLTGRAPADETGGDRADALLFQFHVSAEAPGEVHPVRVPLHTAEGQRVWLSSEQHALADVAVIPIPGHLCEGVAVKALGAEWSLGEFGALELGGALQLIGFPYGLHDQANALPLWQQGHVASEPGMDFDGHPLLAIHATAYPGMSGAPVLASVPIKGLPGAAPRAARRLVGVYSSLPLSTTGEFPEAYCGRGPHEAMHWGHVWRADCLSELLGAVDTAAWERDILAALR